MNFGIPHIVDDQNKIVWVMCTSAITAMGIPAVVNKYYPGYKGKIVSEQRFEELKRQF